MRVPVIEMRLNEPLQVGGGGVGAAGELRSGLVDQQEQLLSPTKRKSRGNGRKKKLEKANSAQLAMAIPAPGQVPDRSERAGDAVAAAEVVSPPSPRPSNPRGARLIIIAHGSVAMMTVRIEGHLTTVEGHLTSWRGEGGGDAWVQTWLGSPDSVHARSWVSVAEVPGLGRPPDAPPPPPGEDALQRNPREEPHGGRKKQTGRLPVRPYHVSVYVPVGCGSSWTRRCGDGSTQTRLVHVT